MAFNFYYRPTPTATHRKLMEVIMQTKFFIGLLFVSIFLLVLWQDPHFSSDQHLSSQLERPALVPFPRLDPLLILYYSPVKEFLGPHWLKPLGTSCPKRCTFTEDVSKIDEATGVVFHIPTLTSPTMYKKKPHQVIVALSMESICLHPALLEEMKTADLEMSYRQEAQVWTPFIHYDLKHSLLREATNKTKLAIAYVEGCGVLPEHMIFFQNLRKHLKVDQIDCWAEGAEETMERLGNYKFMIFFENCMVNDLVTSRVYQALQLGTVPVYWGPSNAEEFLPKDSVIKMNRFKTGEELAEYLVRVDKDEEEYKKWLAWKGLPLESHLQHLFDRTRVGPLCNLCTQLHQITNSN